METEKIILSDNRQLAFTQSGNLTGRPVLFFHGTPGSRFFRPPDLVTTRLGFRLITVDRPGYGSSTFQNERRIADWPADIKQLTDHLQLDSFSIASHSGGGPYALACASFFGKKVTNLAVISSVSPVEIDYHLPDISRINQFGFRIGRYLPWSLWLLIFRMIFHSRYKDPWKDMDRQAKDRPDADAIQMGIPENRNTCYQSEREGFIQGIRGFARDAYLLTRPWGFILDKIEVPVHLWHGTEDNMAPISMADHLSKRLPGSILHILNGEGHLMIFKYWESILSELVSTE